MAADMNRAHGLLGRELPCVAVEHRSHAPLHLGVHGHAHHVEIVHRLLLVTRRELRMILVVAREEPAPFGVGLVRRHTHRLDHLDARRHREPGCRDHAEERRNEYHENEPDALRFIGEFLPFISLLWSFV
jgi:hypothetical protein